MKISHKNHKPYSDWTEVYDEFERIFDSIDDYNSAQDKIRQFYKSGKGKPEFDEAWRKWTKV